MFLLIDMSLSLSLSGRLTRGQGVRLYDQQGAVFRPGSVQASGREHLARHLRDV